jgi:hypothetical protein
MNKEIKAKWLEALRSGRYKQGIGFLRTEENEFCCLGLLCEVIGLEPEKEEGEVFYRYDGCFGSLSLDVQKKCGVKGHSARLSMGVRFGSRSVWTLADLNDEGMSFAQIADVIEKQF